jgi:hypothetical protein
VSESLPQFDSDDEASASGVTSNFGLTVPVIAKGAHYHLRIEMKRANTSQSVEFYGADYNFPN